MKIEMWSIDRPVPYVRNTRKIPQKAIDKVAGSIQEFGWRQPIVVDKDEVIIVGHTRLKGAQKLGLKEVPVHIAENLSEAQVKAYRLADNRTGEETGWDEELLSLEIKELTEIQDLQNSLLYNLGQVEYQLINLSKDKEKISLNLTSSEQKSVEIRY